MTPPQRSESIGSRDVAGWPTRLGRWVVHVVGTFAVAIAARLPERWRPAADRTIAWSAANLAFILFAGVSLSLALALVDVSHEVYEAVVGHDGVAALDQPALDLALHWRSPGLDQAVTLFTDLGGGVGMPILATLVVVTLAVLQRAWTPVVIMVVAAAGSLLMTVVGKDLIGRARPPLAFAVPPYESTPSFPSGHTLNATVLTTVAVYLILLGTTAAWQRVVTVSVGAVFVVLMGLSRVFLGHHWLTDVIAGWAIGLAWALAVITAHRLLVTLRRAARRTS
ncbi:phosphoesterase PA-phosphatase [Intrasporangium chromatireducens Q5-1]|uniref:Phosphoesterase PA-phosphatase n=1 Tax=Intrasporangium chromatireducens Q5-1 TaxID=584657 RepID=W9GNY4_9MICO|nr:phosphoesterase PA-phosphatase [Intrasporangium chromatireducens Q5-1]